VEAILKHWPGQWLDQSNSAAHHEANLLNLQIDKARHRLGWHPHWDYGTTIERTVGWYLAREGGACALDSCLADLRAYERISSNPP
jgi:CDP-glucose 4,6-dehydratase